MANTIVQIKRSQTTASPTALNYGELAYSFQSGKLFLGDISGNPISIGGNTYNQLVDAATSTNTFNTIVKRDAGGSFSATSVYAELVGNAATATKWQTTRLLGVSGDATGQVSVDGSVNANIPFTLVNTGVTASTYGGTSNVPVFTVDAKGRITSAANVSISTSFGIAANTGSDTVNGGETLTFEGSGGIYTTVTNNKVSINVDNSVVRTSGNQTIGGNLSVTGDLIISGNTVSVDVQTLSVEDSLIKLANNNLTYDTVDIGFYGPANSGSGVRYHGLARTVSDSGNFFLFKNLVTDPTGNTIPLASVTQANTATLRANITGGTVSGLNSAISVTDGGTGLRAVANGDILFANGTNTLTTLTKVAAGNVLLSGDAPSWGKVSLTSHISGILPIASGGTNSVATPTSGGVAYGNGSSYLFTTAGTAGQALVSQGSSAPGFGTLDLRGGGLGLTSSGLLANSVLFYSGTGNIISKTNSPSDGHVLQYSTSAGVAFGGLDGGTF